MLKPSTCLGCPFYGNGDGFVPDELRDGAVVLVYGHVPSRQDALEAKPYTGAQGTLLETKFLPLAGLTRDQVSIGHAIRCHRPLKDTPEVQSIEARVAIEHCKVHEKVPASTRLVVTQGPYSLYSMTGEGIGKDRTISSWRGWALPQKSKLGFPNSEIWSPSAQDVPVLATLHFGMLQADPHMQIPTKRDWQKVGKILKGAWPEPMPPIQVLPPASWPAAAAFDTEFNRYTKELIRYSLAWRHNHPYVYVVEAADAHVVPSLVVPQPRVILQNAWADIPYLDRLLPNGYELEDTMLADAVLWSDLPHDLDFLGSMYARTNRWKHLVESNPLVYSGADALGTWDVWIEQAKQLARDPLLEREIYRGRMLPLIPIIARAHSEGMRVDKTAAQAALVQLEGLLGSYTAKAQANVGWPLNLGSPPQVQRQLYEVEGLKVKRGGWGR